MVPLLIHTIHTLVNFKKGKIERVDTFSILAVIEHPGSFILTKMKTFMYVGY